MNTKPAGANDTMTSSGNKWHPCTRLEHCRLSRGNLCNNFSVRESQKINCSVHGWQEQAFVCQHIVQSLHTGVPVGFYWSSQDRSPHPDAWCGDCEKDRLAAGGDWTPEVSAKLGVKLLCGSCYDYAKSIWCKGRKVIH